MPKNGSKNEQAAPKTSMKYPHERLPVVVLNQMTRFPLSDRSVADAREPFLGAKAGLMCQHIKEEDIDTRPEEA